MSTVAARLVALDRSSPVPLYHQLAVQLERAIARGELAGGVRLGNEIELAGQLGVSRPTVRRAIQELVEQGLLVRKRGVGTQVVQGDLRRRMGLTSLWEDLAAAHRAPTTDVLRVQTVAAGEDVARCLGLPQGAEVCHLERVRRADGSPLAVLRNWLPPDLAPAREDLALRGLYSLLRARGVHLSIAHQRIGAVAASAAQARLLGLKKGMPLLSLERVTYDDSGRPVELGRHVYRSADYVFEATVVAR